MILPSLISFYWGESYCVDEMMCVCVCERERERERGKRMIMLTWSLRLVDRVL
mgnify:CR=1 FL=1